MDCSMKPERLFDNKNNWTENAYKISREFYTFAYRLVERHQDIDLRDLSYVAEAAINSAIINKILDSQLSS